MSVTDTIARMPKAELHLHLEGTLGPETLWDIPRRNGVALPVGTLEEPRRLYSFESFDKFLHLWLAMCRCFRSDADYALMGRRVRGGVPASGHPFYIYDLPHGAIAMQFASGPVLQDIGFSTFVPFPDGKGGFFLEGTFELSILDATGIYKRFKGGE